MELFISKWALTRGIMTVIVQFDAVGKVHGPGTVVAIYKPNFRRLHTYAEGDWHYEMSDAIAAAEVMRAREVMRHNAIIDKLECLTFA